MTRRKRHEQIATRSTAGLRVVALGDGFYVFEDDRCRLGKPYASADDAEQARLALESRDRRAKHATR